MYQIRFFDGAAGDLYRKGRVKGGIHAYAGQEAIAVGVSAHLKKVDVITSTHRGHGHHIAKGADMKRLMAEILGKSTGYCHGRGGSMHVAAFEVGSLGAFPVVASGIPSALGAALSFQLRGERRVSVAYFGEGALGQGTFFEALNLASIWGLPVVFVCENNQYAVSTRVDTSIALKSVARLADAFGLQAVDVDGQSLLAVHSAAGEAVARARDGQGPALIHATTYRFEGHYVGEPEIYRTREEVRAARRTRDPILLFRQRVTDADIADEAALNAVRDRARGEVQAALEYAETSPEPPGREYAAHVYAD